MRKEALLAAVAVVALVPHAGYALAPSHAPAARASAPGLSAPLPEGSVISQRRPAGLSGDPGRGSRPGSPHVLTPCGPAWTVTAAAASTWNDVLGGVAASSPTDVWAVGNSQDSASGKDQNLAEHWDGTAWKLVPVPNLGPDGNDLADVAVIDSTHAYAVGISNTTGFHEARAFKWDGSTWSAINPFPGSSPSFFNDVVAFSPTDVWAVGAKLGNDGAFKTLVDHFDGANWTTVASPSLDSGDNSLIGIAGTSSSDLWAVGYERPDNSLPRQTLVEHYTGTWNVVPSGVNPGTDNALYHVSVSGGELLAVGETVSTVRAPLAERYNGSTWSMTSVPATIGSGDNVLEGLVGIAAGDAWAVGYSRATNSTPSQPLVEHWNGSTWTATTAATRGSSTNVLFSIAAPVATDLWAAGYYANPDILKPLAENYSGFATPTGVTAAGGDASASVTWSVPCSGSSATTSYLVSAFDGCTLQGSETVSAPASNFNYTGLTNGTRYSFTVAPVTAFGVGPPSGRSNAVTPSGATIPTWVTACSSQQYQQSFSNGSTWVDVDSTGLSVSFTPGVDSYAIITGNADLWTSAAGYNQDLGVAVTGPAFPAAAGQPEAWKESGGFAGTFSPNAAAVKAVIHVSASQIYAARLVWKANRSDPGTIWAGAGPIDGAFSPTRLTVQLVPVTAALTARATTTQYSLTNSNGSAWTVMDGSNLNISFTPGTGGYAVLVGNADLWTANPGYNQDLGIAMTGPGFPTSAAQPEAWKESGGFAGTFSPNAAAVQAIVPVSSGQTYGAELVWKTNKADGGTIFAGAGPINGHFSPTSLSVFVVPAAPVVASVSQYTYVTSDGSFWQPVDGAILALTLSPSSSTSYDLSANSDLWTSVAGYNQDVGISVSGGAYGQGTVVAWKESGGFAGTFSPNAALVDTALHLQGGTTYVVQLVWKANRFATVANAVWAGAGPINGHFSPTSLIAVPLSSP